MSAEIGCVEGSRSRCPQLLGDGEGGPCLDPPGRLCLGENAGPRRERLVEPKVVPPPHGHQVAEPHVRHLVQDGLGPTLVRSIRDPAAEHVVLVVGDAGRVLHRTGVEVRHEELVVLGERVGEAEDIFEEAESTASDVEQLVGIEVLGEGDPAEQTQRDGALLALVLAADHVVGTRDDGGDVGGQPRRRFESPTGGRVVPFDRRRLWCG